MTSGCESLADLEPQGLAMTYWLDPVPVGAPYPVSIRFVGQRVGATRKRGPLDRFSVVESLQVVPGSGPVAITARVNQIAAGDWQITARPISRGQRNGTARSTSVRVASLATASGSGRTTYAPIARNLAPGAHLGAWPALVGFGLAVALVVQALLVSHLQLRIPPVLLVSAAASLVGLVGAKLYHAAGHYLTGERGALQLLSGTCIQGFLLGAVLALLVGTRVAQLPLWSLLDVTAPGLMFGMAVGRYGCFFGGCCVGRPTASRWGLWSSDRRVGVRRIPTQLLESTLALLVGIAALLAHSLAAPRPAGVVFVGSIAAYTLGRQLLFPLRDRPRRPAWRRVLVLALCAGIVVADVAVAVVTG
jgi:phosphatidylglycerol:prolipoprotein diacylglycerol transferase